MLMREARSPGASRAKDFMHFEDRAAFAALKR